MQLLSDVSRHQQMSLNRNKSHRLNGKRLFTLKVLFQIEFLTFHSASCPSSGQQRFDADHRLRQLTKLALLASRTWALLHGMSNASQIWLRSLNLAFQYQRSSITLDLGQKLVSDDVRSCEMNLNMRAFNLKLVGV